MPLNKPPKLRRRVTESQARDIQALALVSQELHARNLALESFVEKLGRLWGAGIEESGEAEDGTKMKHRALVIAAIWEASDPVPGIVDAVVGMPEPSAVDSSVVQ